MCIRDSVLRCRWLAAGGSPALARMCFLGSLRRKGSKVQSAIRPRPISSAIRLNPQSVMRKM
eukprot:9638231-Alexandrium_andersonii.AAC.1